MPTGDPTCLVHGQIRCNCYENGLRFRWSHLTRDGQDVYVEIHSGEQFMYQGEKGRKAYQDSLRETGNLGNEGKAWSAESTKDTPSKDAVDPKTVARWLVNPANRREQIYGVIYFYQKDWFVYDGLFCDIATALNALVKEMFISNDVVGYRAFVVRKALQALHDPGYIEFDEKPWEMKDGI